MATTPDLGPNEAATQATLERVGADPTTDAVAALALTMAGVLDRGEARSQVAAVARELRACLADVERTHGSTGADELDRFLATLSTPVHTQDDP